MYSRFVFFSFFCFSVWMKKKKLHVFCSQQVTISHIDQLQSLNNCSFIFISHFNSLLRRFCLCFYYFLHDLSESKLMHGNFTTELSICDTPSFCFVSFRLTIFRNRKKKNRKSRKEKKRKEGKYIYFIFIFVICIITILFFPKVSLQIYLNAINFVHCE